MKPVIEIPSEGTIVLYHSRLKTMEKFVDWKLMDVETIFPADKQFLILEKKKKNNFFFHRCGLTSASDFVEVSLELISIQWPVELMLFNYLRCPISWRLIANCPATADYKKIWKWSRMEPFSAWHSSRTTVSTALDSTRVINSLQWPTPSP